MRLLYAIFQVILLAGCAAYSGTGLKPGEAGLDDVLRVMGQPAMRWENPDGSLQLAYPHGPMGFHTYMVDIGKDGKLQRLENVLDPKVFANHSCGYDQEPGVAYPRAVSAVLGGVFQGTRRTCLGMALL